MNTSHSNSKCELIILAYVVQTGKVLCFVVYVTLSIDINEKCHFVFAHPGRCRMSVLNLTPASQAVRYSIYLPPKDGRLSWFQRYCLKSVC